MKRYFWNKDKGAKRRITYEDNFYHFLNKKIDFAALLHSFEDMSSKVIAGLCFYDCIVPPSSMGVILQPTKKKIDSLRKANKPPKFDVATVLSMEVETCSKSDCDYVAKEKETIVLLVSGPAGFELIKDYMKPVLGGNIVDASCGSGLFARLFAKSELFSLVVALDYSENMLQQCYEFSNQEENFPKEKLLLARADISRLPFMSGSIDAVPAGAAIHCWPSPSPDVVEISRVLKPGGVFVGTTYILDGPFSFILPKPLQQNIMQISGSHMFLREQELEDICRACGLVDFKCTRNRQLVILLLPNQIKHHASRSDFLICSRA